MKIASHKLLQRAYNTDDMLLMGLYTLVDGRVITDTYWALCVKLQTNNLDSTVMAISRLIGR